MIIRSALQITVLKKLAGFMIPLLILGLSLSSTLAKPAQQGLAQRNILPEYPFWLTDAAFSELSQEVVTAHTPWATPYAGKELDLVVIAPRWTQRATVELQQRFDFDAIAIMAYRSQDWGDTDSPHYYWISSGTDDILTQRAMATIGARRRPDVIVIGWMNSSVIPQNVQQEIMDAVEDGAGLVIYNPRPLSGNLKTFIDQCKPIADETINAVVDGIPMGNLPPFKPQDPRALVGGGIEFYRSDGGGRIAVAVVDLSPLSVIPVETPNSLGYIGSNSYFSPPASQDVRDIHYDYYSSLAGRLILWAGENMPEVKLTGWEKLNTKIDTKAEGGHLGDLLIRAKILPQAAQAELIIRDFNSTVEQQSILEINEDGQIRVVMEQLKSGGHYADIILRDADGKVLDWGSKHFISNTDAKIVSVTTTKKSHDPKKAVPISITLDGEFTDAKVLIEIIDTHNRQIWEQKVDAQPELSISADFSNALTIQCDVTVTLSKGSIVLAKNTSQVLLKQPNPQVDQYFYGAWVSKGHEFVQSQAANVMASHGVRGGILDGDMDEFAKINVRPTPYVTRYYPDNIDGKGLMIRKPCLTDPKFLKLEKEKIIKATHKNMHYSPVGYSLGDDQGMMLTGQDGCISETCMAAFRQFLTERHDSIKTLNESWGTNYSSFDEAEPLALNNALASGQYPRWAEHRMYMDKLFVDTHIRAKSIVLEIDRVARVGFEGPLMDDSWYGYEWKMLLDNLDFMAVYPNQWKFDLVRSFARPGLLMGGWHGGYAMYQNPDDLRSYPWFMLFNSCNSYWFFCGYGGSEAGHPAESVAPDLRPLKCFTETSKHVNRIQNGIDRLVLNAKPVHDRIAIYYSRSSVHGATVMPAIPTRDYNNNPKWSQYMAAPEMKWGLNIEANLRLLDDMGLSYVFVDGGDIVAGKLKEDNFTMLVMPFVHSLSEAETKAVKDFVLAGGSLLADVRPGVFDENIKLLTKGSLDDLLGIRRTDSAVTPLHDELIEMAIKGTSEILASGGEAGAMLPEQGDYGTAKENDQVQKSDVIPLPIDTTVVATSGKAAKKTELDSPIFIINNYGKGKTCLMNMSVQHYLTLRAAGRGAGLRGLLGDFLTSTDIAPDVRVQATGNHSTCVRVFRYHDGDNLLVGLLRPHKRLLDEPDGFLDTTPRPFVVDFGRKGHVYDIINRTYHGQRDTLELDIEIANAMLFSILPYKITALTAQVSQSDQSVTISPEIQVSQGNPGRHVVNIKVTDANGKHRPEYDLDMIATDGRGSYTFNLAMNDPKGKWIIHLEDVVSSTTHKQGIWIQPVMTEVRFGK
jgi:hypothetical protein